MDINAIPRINSSNILDFQNSYVNFIYDAQSNQVVGALAVGGYFILTILDIIILSWYIFAFAAIAYLAAFGPPPILKAIFEVIFEAIRNQDLGAITTYLEGNTPESSRPDEKSLQKKHTKKSPVKTSTTKKSPETFSTPPKGDPTKTSFLPVEEAPAKISPPKPISTEQSSETTTEAAPAKTLSAKTSPAKKDAAKTSPKTAPAETSSANTSPAKKDAAKTSPETAPAETSSAKTSPAKKDTAKTSSPKTAPSGPTPSVKLSNAYHLVKIPTIILERAWKNKFWVIGFIVAVLAVLQFKYFASSLANDGQANSGRVASPRTDSPFGTASKRTLAGFLQYGAHGPAYLAEKGSQFLGPVATWANAIILAFLVSVVTILRPEKFISVTYITILSIVAILSVYQTLWTIHTLGLFLFLALVAAFGLWNVFPAFVLLALVWGANIICFNSAAITAISLVFIAILAWATQLFVDFMKRTCPTVVGLPFSILTWQPVFWATIFWIGRYHDFFTYSPVDLMGLDWSENVYLFVFLLLATFKGTKIIIHTISYYLYTRPVAPPHNPTITPADVTVIIPTCGPFKEEFKSCLRSILDNEPAQIIVSTCGHGQSIEAIRVCETIDRRIKVISKVPEPCKRSQLIAAVEMVKTPITIYADDHVFWPRTFLRSALAPFEDPIVGLVGTSKRVIRNRNQGIIPNLFNYIACIYLERHNFECTTTYNIDGGVFVISGRTALARTSILHSVEYREKFANERFVGVGPMKVDDDNFNTRFMVNHGFKIVFHNDPRATITTTLVNSDASVVKFRSQLMRWARTTWRSNLKSLITDRSCYQRTPWTTYAMFVSSLVNFAIIYDFGMAYALYMSGSSHLCPFFILLLLSKVIKPLPHLMREYQDWKFVPFGIVFGYFHSFIKFWAMLTMFNVEWCGRDGVRAINHSPTPSTA